jgi:hypothetical protein
MKYWTKIIRILNKYFKKYNFSEKDKEELAEKIYLLLIDAVRETYREYAQED